MNIAHKLHRLVRLDDAAYIAELYRAILDREPDEEGAGHHLNLLRRGTSKPCIALSFLRSGEALSAFERPRSSGSVSDKASVCDAMRRLFAMKPEPFVHSLYRELLCREPDQPAYGGYVDSLHAGAPKSAVYTRFVASAEFEQLLGMDKYAFARRSLDQLIQSFYK